jgi:hypothetical protein
MLINCGMDVDGLRSSTMVWVKLGSMSIQLLFRQSKGNAWFELNRRSLRSKLIKHSNFKKNSFLKKLVLFHSIFWYTNQAFIQSIS